MAARRKKAPETLRIPAPESELRQGKLKAIAGSQDDKFNNVVANQALDALWLAHSDKEYRAKQFQALVSAMIGIGPKNEIEGMLAAQMVATHAAAMECYRRSMIEQQSFEGRRENLNQANKLVRSFAALVETLDRFRGKGQQVVRVEHVTVQAGGQAIVGAVNQGGGATNRTEEQAHAPRTITDEPGTPMRSADTEREAVPVARGT